MRQRAGDERGHRAHIEDEAGALEEEQVQPHREQIPQRRQQVGNRGHPRDRLDIAVLHAEQHRGEDRGEPVPGQCSREEIQHQRVDQVDAEADEVKRESRAAKEPFPEIKIDFDDGAVEMIVAAEIQQVRGVERPRAFEPLEVIVEEIASESGAIDHDDCGRQRERAGGPRKRPGATAPTARHSGPWLRVAIIVCECTRGVSKPSATA